MYVGAYLDRKSNKLFVSERVNGQRCTTEYPLVLEYYIEDENGYYEATNGKKLKKMTYDNIVQTNSLMQQYKESGIKTYELGFNLTNKVLYKYYNGCKAPTLHKSFLDIEVDRKGFEYLTIDQLIDKANCPINAISIYNDWQNTEYTLMLCPPEMNFDEAQKICSEFPNTVLFKEEKDLLEGIILLLDDADTISGWNSEGFDIPYIIRRIENILGKGESNRLNVWNMAPQMKEVEQFGSKKITYSLIGKWSVDYLVLYKKHATSVKDSYKLDNIADLEIGERKVAYEGSLDDLYRENYRLFIDYNRQDTMLVKKLDDKLNYINIHNRQCHDIKCTLEATMGTVAWVDQAIINEAHESYKFVQDKDDTKGQEFNGMIPPGAYVADPVPGLYDWVFSFDMNSLYPTTMRSLNLSPECIVGQINLTLTKPYLYRKIEENGLWKKVNERIPDWGKAWAGDDVWGTLEYQEVMAQSDTELELKIEDGPVVKKKAREIYDLVFNDNSSLSMSAFGTIFRTDKKGLLNQIFTKWYSERKAFKKKMTHYEELALGVKIDNEDLLKQLADVQSVDSGSNKEYDLKKLNELISNNSVDELKQFMVDNDLEVVDNFILSKHKKYFKEQQDYWDLEQYLRKINLNSSYGALLNSNSVFYDFRLGSSTTLSGRKVVQHLTAKANELMIGEYAVHGHCQTYNDTDSVYCSIGNDEFRQKHPDFKFDKDFIKEYADKIGDDINESFPDYMKRTFHCTDEGASLQKAGREVVATKGLFVSKKRYALMVYDKDGFRTDTHGKPGKLKIMGLQIRRSDTPELVKSLLENMMKSLLVEGSKEKLVDILRDFKNNSWDKLKPWEKGTPRAVNKLTYYTGELRKDLKSRIPGHVRASINWNRMLDMMNDKRSPKILDGEKVIVCKMKLNNPFSITSIALPKDINTIPKWFKQLPFDEQSMKDSVVDETIDSIYGILNWGLSLGMIQDENEELNSIISFC